MFDPSTHRTPGQLVHDLLEARGWTQKVLALILGIDTAIISKVIAGKKSVDATLALLLSEVFAVPAEQFLELQSSYDLAQARLVLRPDPGRAKRARLFGELPITEMFKRGWISAEDPRDVHQVEAAITKFFRGHSPEEIGLVPHAAKKMQACASPSPAQLAWIYRVKEIAEEMLVSRYSPEAVDVAIAKLSSLRASADDIRKVPRILQECGIRYVIVEALAGSKIDGVCCWFDEKSPVIGMSLRYDRIDNFWFVLRHELEHVIRLHGQTSAILDFELEGDRAGMGDELPEEERIANQAAAEFCVPGKMLEQFVVRKSPFFAERDIIGFARTLKIHPGLVAGQLQRRTKRYDRFRNHLVKVRSIIAPSAQVDGWGDIMPVGI